MDAMTTPTTRAPGRQTAAARAADHYAQVMPLFILGQSPSASRRWAAGSPAWPAWPFKGPARPGHARGLCQAEQRGRLVARTKGPVPGVRDDLGEGGPADGA